MATLRRERVGGAFWAAQPQLPAGRDVLVAPASRAQLHEMLASLTPLERERSAVLAPSTWPLPDGVQRLPVLCDPWWLASRAALCLCDRNDDLAMVMALQGVVLRQFGDARDQIAALTEALDGQTYTDPFTGEPWSVQQVIAQLGEWRRLIDANRQLDAVYGVARWKRITADPLLWDGQGKVRHRATSRPPAVSQSRAAIWKSRAAPGLLGALTASGTLLSELEDGFIRSVGLGANCVPPLSLICDLSGVYFDPGGPSDLETILQVSDIDSTLQKRASSLRARLVQASISKYGQGGKPLDQPNGVRRRVLVTGQVEDDRSIVCGGAGITNFLLLQRARELEGASWIIYKPHPDVEAGHRKGHIPDDEALRYADEIARDVPITSLLDTVDAVHVITSLAGFEALLRGKQVTTHGTPFYAGWGLTRDLAAIPSRRTRRRSLDELVAATLILYPRYLDPVTRLPCPPEVLVERMANGAARVGSSLVFLRELQGRFQRLWHRATGAR
ncbi:MAG: beta-3-deoxy-D-manno-oct-2-ulosonic acid transferase [Sphingomonadales bacterium]|nr:beta-3-deoxy-D-manno-oct-2-ulosonic acid transferase [Sphingomonadales bacterium]